MMMRSSRYGSYRWIPFFFWFLLVVPRQQQAAALGIHWCPSRVELQGVSQSYPDTFWRKLTSSEPRREFAIEDISLTFQGGEICMLQGASSSGKSTILRLAMGQEKAISGSLQISCGRSKIPSARPILLEERPVYTTNPKRTVRSIMLESAATSLPIASDASSTLNEQVQNELLEEVATTIFDLSLDQKAGDLSPSEAYRCRLAEACLQSVMGSHIEVESSTSSSNVQQLQLQELPAPIIFLDEWMDTETSTVVQKVQPSLDRLVERAGAVVVSVTHKPHLYYTTNSKTDGTRMRRLVLGRGKILSNDLK